MSARLWLIDDDPSMGVIVGLLARRAGHGLTVYRSIEEAWTALINQDTPPSLVLLDVNLTGGSGLEFLRRLARNWQTPVPTALFVSAGMVQDIARAWREGADYFLAKELVTDRSQWTLRLEEILRHIDGHQPTRGLEYSSNNRATLSELTHQAEQLTRFRALDPELRKAVLFRATHFLAQLDGVSGDDPVLSCEAARTWFGHVVDQLEVRLQGVCH
ncbi:MAG: response regulator [Gemmataceae bacterium]